MRESMFLALSDIIDTFVVAGKEQNFFSLKLLFEFY